MSATRVARVRHDSCTDDARGGDCYGRVDVWRVRAIVLNRFLAIKNNIYMAEVVVEISGEFFRDAWNERRKVTVQGCAYAKRKFATCGSRSRQAAYNARK